VKTTLDAPCLECACEQGFVALLEDFEELVLDVPEAVPLMALFVSRAIVDEVLPPSFVTRIIPPPGSHLERMKDLCTGHLQDMHSSERLLRCWGSGMLLLVFTVQRCCCCCCCCWCCFCCCYCCCYCFCCCCCCCCRCCCCCCDLRNAMEAACHSSSLEAVYDTHICTT
jgi:hypothetical protein